MMNEDGGDDSGSGNGCCSWLWIKKKKSNRVQNPNISVASSSETHAVPNSEGGEIVIPFDVMRGVTNNFSEQNILGRGASGTVYLGQISNSKLVAVKRMTGAIAGRADSEFEAEMAVMRTARHQNLVILLGYCLHENEKLLVYEYMPQGTLSRHIFDWADQGLEPLAWSRRLIIALDVARGVEYLHSLAQQSFIHRDLKPSHILLGDDMRAKVADFGLVRLAEGNASIERRVVGTYGYLAPEYANIGRVTTKVDVFSFGVILMELITGRKALDNSQPEDNVVIVPWFQGLDKDSFRTAIDSTIHINEETLASVDTVAQLACHCTASDPKQRPDMGHAVKVLLCLIQDWRPSDSISENTFGIDLDISLPEELEKWKAREGTSHWGESSSSLVPSFDNTDTSIPSHPFGFSGSSTSVDVLHTEKMKGLAPDDASSSRFY